MKYEIFEGFEKRSGSMISLIVFKKNNPGYSVENKFCREKVRNRDNCKEAISGI